MSAQLGLFGEGGCSAGLPGDILSYYPGFVDELVADGLLGHFIDHTNWTQKLVKMYEREILTPRLTAWFGADQIDYAAIGKSVAQSWTPELLSLKAMVEPVAGISFNSVLLNYYRDGRDSVAWHSDKETVMGSHPIIASVSFGQVRRFDVRLKQNHLSKYSLRLEHGSLLLMKGDLQHKWEHRIAKSAQKKKPRINLTFRKIIT
jgi:alkylated DNA repair dioxygenase AlkB